MPRAKATLNRQKSINSQAASISAWIAVLDWPSMLAAFKVSRHGPANKSAASGNRGPILKNSGLATEVPPPRRRQQQREHRVVGVAQHT
jgi:hypothetical protein